MSHCGILPVIRENVTIMEALQGISQRLDRMDERQDERQQRTEQWQQRTELWQQRTEQWQQRIEQRLDNMETNIMAADKNSVARVSNSQISRVDQDLTPLVDTTTNEIIPNFPKTIRDLRALQARALIAITQALGGNGTGTTVNKRKELARLCGLTPFAA